MILALAIGLAGAAPAQEGAPMPSLYDFTLKDIDGRDRNRGDKRHSSSRGKMATDVPWMNRKCVTHAGPRNRNRNSIPKHSM